MKTILLTSQKDAAIHQESALADITICWEDYNQHWSLSLSSQHGPVLYMPEPFHLSAETKLIIREPMDLPPELAHIGLLKLSYPYIVQDASGDLFSLQSKAVQLATLSFPHPRTVICNRPTKADLLPLDWIVKSLSSIRSRVCYRDELDTELLSLPTMFQKRIDGEEFKLHCLFRAGRPTFFNVAINKQSIDYRYQEQFDFTVGPEPEQDVIDCVVNIHAKTKVNCFDVDYIRDREGHLWLLEWNNRPNTVVFSSCCENAGASFIEEEFLSGEGVCLFGAEEDQTLNELNEYLEGRAVRFFFNDIGIGWSFYVKHGQVVVVHGRHKIYPTAVYRRSSDIQNNDYAQRLFIELNMALQCTSVPTIPDSLSAWDNCSKPLQLILKADGQVSTPYSVVTNQKRVMQSLENDSEHHYIVKSMCGVRSIVVDQEVWRDWTYIEPGLPVLFQRCLIADDIRVHVIDGKVYSVRIMNKSGVDYRYGQSTYTQIEVLPPAIQAFCIAEGYKKNNPLVGIDLMQDSTGQWHYLETNPNPGWNFFFLKHPLYRRAFIKNLWEALYHNESD